MSPKKLSSNEPSRAADSRQAQVLAMLHRKQGATIATVNNRLAAPLRPDPARGACWPQHPMDFSQHGTFGSWNDGATHC
jgi:hypothetical protein